MEDSIENHYDNNWKITVMIYHCHHHGTKHFVTFIILRTWWYSWKRNYHYDSHWHDDKCDIWWHLDAGCKTPLAEWFICGLYSPLYIGDHQIIMGCKPGILFSTDQCDGFGQSSFSTWILDCEASLVSSSFSAWIFSKLCESSLVSFTKGFQAAHPLRHSVIWMTPVEHVEQLGKHRHCKV